MANNNLYSGKYTVISVSDATVRVSDSDFGTGFRIRFKVDGIGETYEIQVPVTTKDEIDRMIRERITLIKGILD